MGYYLSVYCLKNFKRKISFGSLYFLIFATVFGFSLAKYAGEYENMISTVMIMLIRFSSSMN